VDEDTQLHTSPTRTSGRGRDPYTEVGRAFRHSLTMLHRPLTEAEQAATGLPERASRMAVAVHGVAAGALLASYSHLTHDVYYPLHKIADVLGLDAFADSVGEHSEEDNGKRGRQARYRIGKALDELHARGALQVVMIEHRYGAPVAMLTLPDVPYDWNDPTYRNAPTDRKTVTDHESSVADSATAVSDSATRVAGSLTTNEKQNEKQNERASEPVREHDPERSPARPSLSNQKQEQASETARTGQRASDTPSANTGKQAEDVERARTLAALLPGAVKANAPGGTETLALAVLGHSRPEHANAVRKLRTWIDAGADDELARFLDAKAKVIPPATTSLAGLVLTWLRDLAPTPPHEPKHYRHGFPFRDALRAAGLGGTGGLLVVGSFALAAETVLDAGHDPATDPDGFLAVLASTLLPHVREPDDVDLRPLQAFARDASPVPWNIPDGSVPNDASPRGTAALDLVGLAGTDPRASGVGIAPVPTYYGSPGSTPTYHDVGRGGVYFND